MIENIAQTSVIVLLVTYLFIQMSGNPKDWIKIASITILALSAATMVISIIFLIWQ